VFRSEYEANLSINTLAWNDLLRSRDRLDEPQKALLDGMGTNREQFLELVPSILSDLEGPRWREDLFLFSNEGLPITNRMGAILDELTSSQQTALALDLSQGSQDLNITNQRNLAIGGVALVVGLALAAIFAANISGPVRRLTLVAELIEGGDLDARAKPESRDEIGTLAETFNAMADQIQANLVQIRQEKKRADDLLDVVIPIGVSLTGERDFNRLLENMLVQAKDFCRARAGTLYLREGNTLRYVIMRNDAMNLAQGGTTGNQISFPTLQLLREDGAPNYDNVATYVAHKGVTVNLPDVNMQQDPDFPGPRAFNTAYGYTTTSFLTMPLRSNAGETLGVLQLIDAVDPQTGQVVSFDANLQRMMESFSSLAVAALEAYIREQSLRAQIQQLHIEIDEAKRQRAVSEIVDTDFFQGLQAKARETRRRARDRSGDQPEQETPVRRNPDEEGSQQ
jgi:methyl-accepting chemotaxis protein